MQPSPLIPHLSIFAMKPQLKFFDDINACDPPEGIRYSTKLISPGAGEVLIARVRELPFKEFEFHGFKGKRRTVSYGWHYEFAGRGALRKAEDIPEFLLPLRTVAAKFARLEPESLQHVLVIEYGPGAGIGWHRDKPVFGEVIGVSLLAPCVLRFRRKVATKSGSTAGWERFSLLTEPGSAYHLAGPARNEWEHSILRVDELRYSVTFRTMRDQR